MMERPELEARLKAAEPETVLGVRLVAGAPGERRWIILQKCRPDHTDLYPRSALSEMPNNCEYQHQIRQMPYMVQPPPNTERESPEKM